MTKRYKLASTVLLLGLTYLPVFLSLLSFRPDIFSAHPAHHLLLGLAPWWLAYISARWYIRLSQKSSPFYHPLGCLAQCCVWVFHWVASLYHACFVTKFTMRAYFTTVFCVGIVVVTEGLFHSLITTEAEDVANIGVYEKLRRSYGQGLVGLTKLWYLVDRGRPSERNWIRPSMRSRSMTL